MLLTPLLASAHQSIQEKDKHLADILKIIEERKKPIELNSPKIDALSTMRGVPTNLGPVGSKAPRQVTPGVRELEGHYIDDLGRSQPWRAHYDEHGRMIGRTDYNAGNRAAGIPDIHHERWEYNAQFPLGRKVENHIPGEFLQ